MKSLQIKLRSGPCKSQKWLHTSLRVKAKAWTMAFKAPHVLASFASLIPPPSVLPHPLLSSHTSACAGPHTRWHISVLTLCSSSSLCLEGLPPLCPQGSILPTLPEGSSFQSFICREAWGQSDLTQKWQLQMDLQSGEDQGKWDGAPGASATFPKLFFEVLYFFWLILSPFCWDKGHVEVLILYQHVLKS